MLNNPNSISKPTNPVTDSNHGLQTPNEIFFLWNPNFLGYGRQFGQIIIGAVGGIFGRFISTHFGTVSHLAMFSFDQPFFLLKTKPLYSNPKYLFEIGIWIRIRAVKKLGNQPSCVRSPCFKCALFFKSTMGAIHKLREQDSDHFWLPTDLYMDIFYLKRGYKVVLVDHLKVS